MGHNGSKCMTPDIAQQEIPMRGLMTYISETLESLAILVTTDTYLYGISAGRRSSLLLSMTMAFVLLCNLYYAPLSWSKECGEEKNDRRLLEFGFALAQPPVVDFEAKQ